MWARKVRVVAVRIRHGELKATRPGPDGYSSRSSVTHTASAGCCHEQIRHPGRSQHWRPPGVTTLGHSMCR